MRKPSQDELSAFLAHTWALGRQAGVELDHETTEKLLKASQAGGFSHESTAVAFSAMFPPEDAEPEDVDDDELDWDADDFEDDDGHEDEPFDSAGMTRSEIDQHFVDRAREMNRPDEDPNADRVYDLSNRDDFVAYAVEKIQNGTEFHAEYVDEPQEEAA